MPTIKDNYLDVDLGTAAEKNVGTAPDEIPTNADLPTFGTAAEADVTTSPTDTTAGRLTKVGDFGWGSNNRVLTTDLDSTVYAGLYGFSVGAVGNPTSLEGSLLVFPRSNTSSGVRYIQQAFFEDGSQQTRTNTNGAWSAWQPVYTGANLNPNVFGGLAANDTIAIGFAQNSVEAIFALPISLINAPSSITVTGTFSILNTAFSAEDTGISTISLSARSSNKIALCSITTGGGLTGGQTLQLVCESGSSKVTVNP